MWKRRWFGVLFGVLVFGVMFAIVLGGIQWAIRPYSILELPIVYLIIILATIVMSFLLGIWLGIRQISKTINTIEKNERWVH